MKTIIHNDPGFVLEAERTEHPITGPTLQLWQTYPSVAHPHRERVLSLTLPQSSLDNLAAVAMGCHAYSQTSPDCGGAHHGAVVKP